MKDIYIIMNGQNILNYYGSKLDLKLDSSELYDYQLATNEVDYDTDVLINIPIIYSALTIDSSCLDVSLNDQKPWIIPINKNYTGDTCDFTVRRRTEKGWTLDFIFNRESINWSGGNIFYYLGIDGDTTDTNYLDNNLTFGFTNNGRVYWNSFHYSGSCSLTGYTETNYVAGGQTPILCTTGNTSDFNLTIVFKRYKEFDGCDLDNMGGFNDLIRGPHAVPFSVDPTTGVTAVTSTQIVTGYIITNNVYEWITGGTVTTQYVEELNKKWSDERDRRLGDLKFYLNGNLIYTEKNWEEIIPSYRNNQTIIQSWGGGYNYSHFGPTQYICGFNIKSIKYYEEPLDFIHIKHNFKTLTGYTFEICNAPCVDNVYRYVPPTSTPTPTPHPTSTPTPTPTLVPTATPTVTPTPTPAPTHTPTPTPTSTPTSTPTPTPTSTPTITPTPTSTPVLFYYYNVNIWTGSCSNYVSTKARSTIPFTIGKFYDNTLYTLVYEIVSFDVTSGGTNNITSVLVNTPRNTCSTVTPTPTPTPTDTPTSTPTPTTIPNSSFETNTTGFTFPFDYMLVEYFFTDGEDMDTQTYISNPSIMTFSDVYDEGYVGTCGQSDSRMYFPNDQSPILTYSHDNQGNGTEAVLFDLTQFKLQYTGDTNIELTFTAVWYDNNPAITGVYPVYLRATLWQKDGINLPQPDGYTFIYPESLNTFTVQNAGQVINKISGICEPFELVGKFQYNIDTHFGQFV
jgi:hypothetical protein